MIYITGDTHGDFSRIQKFCLDHGTHPDRDIMIILGDAGINYYLNWRDIVLKKFIATLPITLFCIHGNHEQRPQSIDTYSVMDFHGGKVYVESQYPNILFADDGCIYDFNGLKCLVAGGAYSVDKKIRLDRGLRWFDNEQPCVFTKEYVLRQCQDHPIDVVLSHTCPKHILPVEAFLPGIDQSTVDQSTEEWLEEVFTSIYWKQLHPLSSRWFCGHYHIDKSIHIFRFMFNDIMEFPSSPANDAGDEAAPPPVRNQCFRCGQSSDADESNPLSSFHVQPGYGSRYDMQNIQFSLCNQCLDSFIDHAVATFAVNPIQEQ